MTVSNRLIDQRLGLATKIMSLHTPSMTAREIRGS